MTLAQKVSTTPMQYNPVTYKAGLKHNLQQQETKPGASQAVKSQPWTKVTKKKEG